MAAVGLVSIVIQALIGSLIGAVFLRAACALFNKLFPEAVAGEATYPVTTVDSPVVTPPQSDDDNPYRAPAATSYISSEAQAGIEIPAFSKAIGIMLVSTLFTVLVSVFWGMAVVNVFDPAQVRAVVLVISVLQAILVHTVVFRLMLPTKTFGSALILSVFWLVIAFLTGLAIAAIVGIMVLAFGMVGK